MDFIENIGVCEEGAEARFRAQIDRPATILDVREVGGVGIPEDSAAKGNETRVFLFQRIHHSLRFGWTSAIKTSKGLIASP